MFALPASFYAQWRLRSGVVLRLRDDEDSPPERLLQAIWQHQRLRRDQLKTVEGTPVRILHPGFRSVEGGPDFRGAMAQIGDGPVLTGDLEVDLRTSGWRAHGHDRNPAFQKVILHVIWEGGHPAADGPPAMALRGVLDAPLGELSLWLGGEAAQGLPEEFRGKCCAPLRDLPPERLEELLGQAASVRLQSKAAQFQARARQVGWEQSLWEGVFRALGYKHNVWPMQRLGELRDRWTPGVADARAIEARLLGIGGLLPAEMPQPQAGANGYVRQMWDYWWRDRDAFADCLLPRSLWRLHGLRPANYPQRRLALASRWCVRGDLVSRIEKWCALELSAAHLAGALLETLQVAPDEFWSWHWTLRSSRLKHAQLLLGATRVTDLAINVVLPWLWIRAAEGKNQGMCEVIQRRYLVWPPAEDNSLLRLARERLLGGASPRVLKTAAAQQGLIQIIRDYCEHSNAICDQCQLPGMVREFNEQGN